jgi:2-polyprenyl-3-methyl-5-hydroxy-6-metoxy-1,4-benzoquinol methylase
MSVHGRAAAALVRAVPDRIARKLFQLWIVQTADAAEAPVSLRRLLELDADLAWQIDRLAIAYDGGVHAKHRLMRYHDFFVERVHEGERVLDVGSGKGELAHDLATRASASVVGIDVDPGHLAFARERYRHERLEFVEANALETLPEGPFDVVILSNVLEHIAPRVELLVALRERTRASRFLIRVPLYSRDWKIPLRRELGLPYYSDPTHEIEHTPDELRDELRRAGLELTELVVNWGEIWVEARPA